MTDEPKKKYPKRGLASMSPEQRREIASKGGKASGGNFKHNHERAKEMSRLGVLKRKENDTREP